MATIQIYDAKQNKVVTVEKIEKTDEDWKKVLNKKECEITTKKGTDSNFVELLNRSVSQRTHLNIPCS